MTSRGIGGIFFKCDDPAATARWYDEHLGMHRDDDGYIVTGWREIDGDGRVGESVFAPFPADTDYFGDGDQPFMFNLRVHDLDALLAKLQAAGVVLAGEPQAFDYGKFGWIIDCDGRKVELWEPPDGDTGFTVTVPPTPREMTGVWLAPPGHTVAAGAGEHADRKLTKRVRVPLPVAEVWRLWTTSEGVAEWLVEHNNVELRLGGPYEFYFNHDEEPGSRGGEGNRILSFLPNKMLSFTWNAPPHLDYARHRQTHCVVEFDGGDRATDVTLHHLGWPTEDVDDHPQWQQTWDYFDKAWESVMAALARYAADVSDRPAPTTIVPRAEPVLPVSDVADALERYAKLGFVTEAYEHEDQAFCGFVCMGPTRFHVAHVDGLDPLQNTSAVYLYVDDADAFHDRMTSAGVKGRVEEPRDTDYGLREFAWVDVDGNLFRVGSPL